MLALLVVTLAFVVIVAPAVGADDGIPAAPRQDDLPCYAVDATKTPPEVYEVPC